MKTWLFSFILVPLFCFSPNSEAHYHSSRINNNHCLRLLDDISHEFDREPQGEHGLVTSRVPITQDSLVEAYIREIFPWVTTKWGTAAWFSPPERGVLFFANIREHLSDRDLQFLRNAHKKYEVIVDGNFEEVMHNCATAPRKDENGEQEDSWIKEDFLKEYPKLAKKGLAHSVEVRRKDNGKMVAGLYGVFINGKFSGESMYHDPGENNAGKLALISLVDVLSNAGHTWLDAQVNKALIKQLGGVNIARDDYWELVDSAITANLPFQRPTN